MAKEIKTPWYKYYDGIKEHLEYSDTSLYDTVVESMLKHPDYISYDYYGNKKTYSEFVHEIDVCAKSFKQMGVGYKDIICICMPNTPEAIISFYALNKIGAIANLIHPLSGENEIKYFLNLTKSKYIVTIDLAFNKINHIIDETDVKECIVVSARDSMPIPMKIGYDLTKGREIKLESSPNYLKWKEFIELGKYYKEDIVSNYKGSDVAVILYSGGTTGNPKGIELTNYSFNAVAKQGFEACGCLQEKDKVLAIMPIFHGFGLGICIHTVQYFGGTSILIPQFKSSEFGKLIKKNKPNIIAGVPTLFEALLKSEDLDGVDLSFLKCVISGGDTLSVSLKRKIDSFLEGHGANIQVRPGYGLTECVTGTCLTPMNHYKEGSIGIPYPDVYYKIVRANTDWELPYGKEGEIVITGPTIMKGYLHNPKETKKTLKKHRDGRIWLHTGDLGYMDSDGFVYFKQRIKRLIVSSGYNLYPQYIENVIESNPKVLISCVIGIPHPYKIQVAKAFIVLKKGYVPNEETLNEIKATCEKNLSKYSLPYEYEFRKDLPRTLVGKVAYRKLEEEEKNKNSSK